MTKSASSSNSTPNRTSPYSLRSQERSRTSSSSPAVPDTQCALPNTVQHATQYQYPVLFTEPITASSPSVLTSSRPPDQPPRPSNSWLIFRSDMDAIMTRTDKDWRRQKLGYKSSFIGKMWADAPPEVREDYQRRADILAIEHKQKYPNYKFQPRKAGEKLQTKLAQMDEKTLLKHADKLIAQAQRMSHEYQSNPRNTITPDTLYYPPGVHYQRPNDTAAPYGFHGDPTTYQSSSEWNGTLFDSYH